MPGHRRLQGRGVISIMATIARQENIRRSERIRAGLARTKAAGTKLGRPRGQRQEGE
jgi:DNA invertase Pin-like site-specific DNA recombinase